MNLPSFPFSDLSSDANLQSTVVGCFNHQSEEVKSAASYALGNVALGNLEFYLPFVLKEIETQPKRQYLLLHSLKEVGQVYFTFLSLFDKTSQERVWFERKWRWQIALMSGFWES